MQDNNDHLFHNHSLHIIWNMCFCLLIHIVEKLRWLCSMGLLFSRNQQAIQRSCFALGNGRNVKVASKCTLDINEKVGEGLAGMVECHPMYLKVASSWVSGQYGVCRRQLMDVSLSHQCFSLSPSPFHTLSKNQ
uniref:Uncharacterized protein n=1 Tax=Pipistrellus kuhlii TaxID=59472 RepID=A0A7J7ZJ34_PIPKU|nr:hypothetical protein mPipKuh1_009496 [Pipistrellus kuhlii]